MSVALMYLAVRLAEEEGIEYSEVVVAVLGARFSFATAWWTALVCLRGSRSLLANRHFRVKSTSVELSLLLVLSLWRQSV